jgi:hypothetical protein
MATGLRRSTGRGDKDKIPFGLILFRDIRRPWELLQIRVLGVLLLRLSSLLEGGGMMLNVEAIPIIQTPRDFIIQRLEICKEIRCSRDTQRIFEFSQKCNLRSVNAKIWKNFLPGSRRRATGERLRRNGRIIIFIRRKVTSVKILRILNSISFNDILMLRRGARCRGSNGGQFFWHLGKLAPGKFASFRLGRVAPNYVDNLSKKHRFSLQIPVERFIKHQRNSIR